MWYNNVTFYVRYPLDFANNFLCRVEPYKLSQIRHLEIRLEGIPIGVDGWLGSAPIPSNWSHHQIRKLLQYYPELQRLDTLVIKIEKFGDRLLASGSYPILLSSTSQLRIIDWAWSQNKDTGLMRSEVRRLNLAEGWRNFNLGYTVFDDQVDKKDRRCAKSRDGKHQCEINMKRIFQITLWKDTDFEAESSCL